ncbi:hypothetical protein, partial [Streptomyces galilaeus]|uniref:hypothetical protein n=1 Tax=Streptomyces galilaeus TaxID=33899 RepID=UPI0038F69CBC
SQMLEDLRKEWKEVESSLAPKKKFAFSNRSKVTPGSLTNPVSTLTETPPEKYLPSLSLSFSLLTSPHDFIILQPQTKERRSSSPSWFIRYI